MNLVEPLATKSVVCVRPLVAFTCRLGRPFSGRIDIGGCGGVGALFEPDSDEDQIIRELAMDETRNSSINLSMLSARLSSGCCARVSPRIRLNGKNSPSSLRASERPSGHMRWCRPT